VAVDKSDILFRKKHRICVPQMAAKENEACLATVTLFSEK
jgi:hypothetical protein